jgi:GNAT superfamily N-acetyltransferase
VVFRFRKRVARARLDELFAGLPASRRPPQTPGGIAKAQQVITAWHRDKLVGLAHASATGKTAVLSWIYVRESHRGRGIGRAMVERLLARFPRCARAKLVANRAAVGFYRKCGFRPRRDAVPMMRDL